MTDVTEARVSVAMNPATARALTDRIAVGVEAVWHLVEQAYTERAWAALGYTSWDDYCTREFGTSRLRLPREERAEVVASLRESGLSQRAIAAATGLSKGSVQNALGDLGGQNCPRDPVTGMDGKTYSPTQPRSTTIIHDEDGAEVGRALDDRQFEDMSQDEIDDALMDEDAEHWVDQPEQVEPQLDPKPAPTGTSRPRRRPITDQAQTAGWELIKAVERIQRIAADDRFEPQKEKVTPHLRGHLINTINACQDVLDRLPQGE